MLFSSLEFVLCFLPVALILYSLLPTTVRPLLLVGMSCLFYIWGEHYYSITIFGLSIVNYALGRKCDPKQKHSRIYYLLAVIINVGTLLLYPCLGHRLRRPGRVAGQRLADVAV